MEHIDRKKKKIQNQDERERLYDLEDKKEFSPFSFTQNNIGIEKGEISGWLNPSETDFLRRHTCLLLQEEKIF